jgi:hypothetical protein
MRKERGIMSQSIFKKLVAAIPVLALAATLAGCGGGGGNQTSTTNASNTGTGTATTTTTTVSASGTTLTQVERLARPAINEGLETANADLNAFNSIPPSSDVAALGTSAGSDAIATLIALGNNASQIQAIVAALIPDVMRIDTTITSGYTGGITFTGAPFTSNIATIPTGGRLILDDVIADTLAVLTHGAIVTDNVSYTGNNFAQGHQTLSTSFPYLAPPN